MTKIRDMPRYSNYEREIRRRLQDANAWPGFLNANFAERLERIAVDSLARRTSYGDVAAIVIFHQLVEQMLHVLIADVQFFEAASILPARISFPEPQRQTFGQVLNVLRFGVEFSHKERLLNLAEALNKIRNSIAHRLLRRGTLRGLRNDARRSHRIFNRIFSIYDSAHDKFRVTFHS